MVNFGGLDSVGGGICTCMMSAPLSTMPAPPLPRSQPLARRLATDSDRPAKYLARRARVIHIKRLCHDRRIPILEAQEVGCQAHTRRRRALLLGGAPKVQLFSVQRQRQHNVQCTVPRLAGPEARPKVLGEGERVEERVVVPEGVPRGGG